MATEAADLANVLGRNNLKKLRAEIEAFITRPTEFLNYARMLPEVKEILQGPDEGVNGGNKVELRQFFDNLHQMLRQAKFVRDFVVHHQLTIRN